MDYKKVEDARDMPGLRLALTVGVPGPWSQAAKYVFEVKNIPFVPVAQLGGAPNDELYDWTGHRNAPVAVYDDEAPRTGWLEILELAERLAPDPALLPTDGRAEILEIVDAIASEGGLAWQRRLQMIPVMTAPDMHPRVRAAFEVLGERYGYSDESLAQASAQAAAILDMLAGKLSAQQARGSGYFVGDGFTAADLYWACFSQIFAAMPEDVNPMPAPIRPAYTAEDPLPEILLAHRDMVYARHLTLPLDF